jgi:hypothetical protein
MEIKKEFRIQNTEDRRQKTEYRRQKTEYRRQETEGGSQGGEYERKSKDISGFGSMAKSSSNRIRDL